MKLYLYARKSTDREDKQVQSLEDQIKCLVKLANDLWHEIVEVIQESASAKAPGRPLFNKMRKDIEVGKAEGVLCWKIDRLYRNPLDAWSIQWMMQAWKLKLIQTPERAYCPEDNVLLLNIESGMAQQYINDLRKGVVRGMNSKIQKGWIPWRTPIWYLNDSETRTVVTDPVRWGLVKKMWDTMLMGCYSVPQILDMATSQWWLDMKKTRNRPCKPLTLSSTYNMFRNIFYTWMFDYAGQRYPGQHKPMITLEQYLRVQEILDGKQMNAGSQKHDHAFTGFMRCAECWYHITCDVKSKEIKSTGETKTYHYYKCSGKGPKCSQVGKSLRSEELEEQIDGILASVQIRPEFREWWIRMVRKHFQEETDAFQGRLDALDIKISSLNKKKNHLLECLLEELISKSEYEAQKEQIEHELIQSQAQKQTLSQSASVWVTKIEQAFDFMSRARESFARWSQKTKREIARALGQNFLISERMLNIELHWWLSPIVNNNKVCCVGNGPSEPKENPSGKAFAVPWEVYDSNWWTHLGSNQGPIGYEPTALTPELWVRFMAASEGFEPSRQLSSPYRISNPAPSATWVTRHVQGLYEKLAPEQIFIPHPYHNRLPGHHHRRAIPPGVCDHPPRHPRRIPSRPSVPPQPFSARGILWARAGRILGNHLRRDQHSRVSRRGHGEICSSTSSPVPRTGSRRDCSGGRVVSGHRLPHRHSRVSFPSGANALRARGSYGLFGLPRLSGSSPSHSSHPPPPRLFWDSPEDSSFWLS